MSEEFDQKWEEYENMLSDGKDPFFDYCKAKSMKKAFIGISFLFEHILSDIVDELDYNSPLIGFTIVITPSLRELIPKYEIVYNKFMDFIQSINAITNRKIDIIGNSINETNDVFELQVVIQKDLIIVRDNDRILWSNDLYSRKRTIVNDFNDLDRLFSKFKSEIIDSGRMKGVYFRSKDETYLYCESDLLSEEVDPSNTDPILTGEDVCQSILGIFLYYRIAGEVRIEAQRHRNRPDIEVICNRNRYVIEVKTLGLTKHTPYGLSNIYEGIKQVIEYKSSEPPEFYSFYSIAIFDVNVTVDINQLKDYCSNYDFSDYQNITIPFWKLFRLIPISGGLRSKFFVSSNYETILFSP